MGKATLAACQWIEANHPARPGFLLSGNIDTDKKHSQINKIETRCRRVVAEAILSNAVLQRVMGVDAARLFHIRQIFPSRRLHGGVVEQRSTSANGLATIFITTGQDVANVAESQAAIVYAQLLASGDYYWSLTLPSLIVATSGGGTGLATQRECLDMLGCYGAGRVNKFAEICAAPVLAGETSLSSAIALGD